MRALVYTRTSGYRHASIPAALRALEAAAGLQVLASEDPADLHALDQDVVLFVSTTGPVLDGPARAELQRYVQGGGGFVGVHAAANAEPDWPWFGELLGARFAGHPEGTQEATATVLEHPSSRGQAGAWRFTDEWYAFTEVRADLEVVMTVEESSYRPGAFTMPGPHPQAWARRVGEGRSWFTALGHDDLAWADRAFLSHLLAGLAWAAGEG